MKIEIQNIVFIPDADSFNPLRAVFDVVIRVDSFEGIRLVGFRYFEPQTGSPYVSEPAVKTERGYVRPVRMSAALLSMIFTKFDAAWDQLIARRTHVPVSPPIEGI